MASLDEIFYKEFIAMMAQRKGESGVLNLEDIPLPDGLNFFVEHREKAIVSGINDQYYGKLNNEVTLLWGTKALNRRKFDNKGTFLTDKDGKYILEPVPCPQECSAIISDRTIGVPYKYKCEEPFQYVDMVQRKNSDGSIQTKYVYIVPRKYLFKVNQTALVFSWTKLRVFYSGVALSLTNGHVLFVYIIPYKPTNVMHNYRVIHCKTSSDYSEELSALRDFWVRTKYMFNPNDCQILDIVKGRENMAYLPIDGVLDMYEMFDPSKSMSDTEEQVEDIYV